MSEWAKVGGTLSHKNACKEFGVTEEEIINAIAQNKLQYRQNWAHGNPYYRVLTSEVKELALKLHGNKAVEEQKMKKEMLAINKEINSLKRKLSVLEKQKSKLIEIQENAVK